MSGFGKVWQRSAQAALERLEQTVECALHAQPFQEERAVANKVIERLQQFSAMWSRELMVAGRHWRYCRLGAGPAVLWLTGGLRRAAYGYAFMERLARRHTVIAPDYPPLQAIDEYITGLDGILAAEGVETVALGGQSYGGILAQAYLALRPERVQRLVLSSTGPADYGRLWAPVDGFFAWLARVLPERRVKNLLAGGLAKAFSAPEAERVEWLEAMRETMAHDLTRADVVSHFAVAADLFRRGFVRRGAFAAWPGRVVILSAENDPTQGKGDRARFEALFGRPVEVLSLGTMGHTAAISDPDRYVEVLEQALA